MWDPPQSFSAKIAKMCQGDQRTWRNQEQRIEIIHQMYENTKPGVQQEGLKYSQEPIARSIQDVILETQRHLADQLILANCVFVIVL